MSEPYYCPVPNTTYPNYGALADDVKIICTTHDNPKWGCDECPDLQKWRELFTKRQEFVDKKMKAHYKKAVAQAKKEIKP